MRGWRIGIKLVIPYYLGYTNRMPLLHLLEPPIKQAVKILPLSHIT